MINFRYHLISVVAIFLALGIGIVMGSTVIDRAIVTGLQNRIDAAEKNSIERKVENDRLSKAVKKQDEQDVVLAGHAVRGYLAEQTVYVMTIGDVPDSTLVETRELLAVSGARLGAQIKFTNDFLLSDKKALAQELNSIARVNEFFAGEKNRDRQIMLALTHSLALEAGTADATEFPANQVLELFKKYNAFSKQEEAASFVPVQNVSFILLANRANMTNEFVSSFLVNSNTSYSATIGLVGDDAAVPSRAKAVTNFGEQLSLFSIVDNAESPSGRAALVIAHSQTIGGKRAVYGVSDKAGARAPELNAP